MKPKVSIIIPAYNVENYIAETLQSVKKQILNPSDFELVIVDDKSTDNTVEVITREIQNVLFDVNFVLLEKNLGAAVARNRAIDQARGKYIIPLDADDLLEPNALKSMLKFMDENPLVQYAYSNYLMIDEQGIIIRRRSSPEFDKEKLLHFNYIGHVKCFTRALHDEIGGYNNGIRYGQDWEHVLRASEVLGKDQIAHNPEFLYFYRVRDNSISTGNGEERKKCVELFLTAAFKRRGRDAKTVSFSHVKDGHHYYQQRELK